MAKRLIMGNFLQVHIEPYEPPSNLFNQAVVTLCAWCRRPAEWRLRRTSKFSGSNMDRLVCDEHIQEWRKIEDPVEMEASA